MPASVKHALSSASGRSVEVRMHTAGKGLPMPAKKLDSSGSVITLTVTGKSPEGAASVANELADRTSKAAIDAMKLDAVNIMDRASVPENPSGPNRVMYTAVALLAGLFVAIAIIVLQDMLDTTVKSGDDAEELLGIPVLGRMPKPKKAR